MVGRVDDKGQLTGIRIGKDLTLFFMRRRIRPMRISSYVTVRVSTEVRF